MNCNYCKRDAWKFFYPAGNGKAMVTINPDTGEEEDWVLHHVDIEMKKRDPERYKQWRIEDLIMVKRKDHPKLHFKDVKRSVITKAKISKKLKNRKFSKESLLKMSKGHIGNRLSEESKKKIGEGIKRYWRIKKIKMKEQEIVNKLVNAFAEIEDATTISAVDFSEERTSNMIVVGIENTTQVNVNLPDYQYRVSIVIDCFIDNDENGSTFNEIHKNVRRIIDSYEHKDKPLDSLFEEIPVVGFFFESEDMSVDDKSNRVVLYCNVIASF